MTDTRHDCPGQCGRKVGRTLLACGQCWGRLPDHLRRALVVADARRRSKPNDLARVSIHRHALRACLAWYIQNNRKESQP